MLRWCIPFALIALLVPTVAQAQDEKPPAPSIRPSGPVVGPTRQRPATPYVFSTPSYLNARPQHDGVKTPVAIALGAVGVSLVAGGIVAVVDSEDQLSCFGPGIACDARRDDLLYGAGLSMLTGGISTMVISGSLLATSFDDRPRYPNRDDSLMGAGILLTGLGAAGIASSASLWIYGVNEESGALAPAFLMSLISGGVLGAGVPMWFKGARGWWAGEDQSPTNDAKAPTARRSPAMFSVGIVLIGGSAAIIATSIGNTIASGDSHSTGATLIPSFLVAGGLLGTGLPLMLKGAERVSPTNAYAHRSYEEQTLVPEIEIGPAGMNARWRF